MTLSAIHVQRVPVLTHPLRDLDLVPGQQVELLGEHLHPQLDPLQLLQGGDGGAGGAHAVVVALDHDQLKTWGKKGEKGTGRGGGGGGPGGS